MVAPAVAAGAAWSLRWQAVLDTASSWVPNMRKIGRDLKDTKIMGQEMGVVFDQIGGFMKSLTLGAVGLGLALVGALTAGIALSPQFQAFIARLQPAFIRLTHYLGQKFQPVMERLIPFITKVVDKIIKIGEKTGLFDALATATIKAVDAAEKLFDWLDKIGALEAIATGITIKVEGISEVLEWIIGAFKGEGPLAPLGLPINILVDILGFGYDAFKWLVDNVFRIVGPPNPGNLMMNFTIGILGFGTDAFKWLIDVIRNKTGIDPLEIPVNIVRTLTGEGAVGGGAGGGGTVKFEPLDIAITLSGITPVEVVRRQVIVSSSHYV